MKYDILSFMEAENVNLISRFRNIKPRDWLGLLALTSLIAPILFWQKINGVVHDYDVKLEELEEKVAALRKEGFLEGTTLAESTPKIAQSIVVIADGNGSVGTGFYVTNNLVATAKHVVEGKDPKKVTILDTSGKTYQVKEIILSKNGSDLALVKTSGLEHIPVEMGYWENIQVGEDVGLIGFTPSYGEFKLARGIVSGKSLDDSGNKIFTVNTFINNGNSGGPIFSYKTGRVIGVISSRGLQPLPNRIPLNLESGVTVGGIDPLKLSSLIYNDMLYLSQYVSQIGVGNAYALDLLKDFNIELNKK